MSLLSQRVNNLGESKTLAMARMTNELKAQGVDVTNLTLGEPDFSPFDFFKIDPRHVATQLVMAPNLAAREVNHHVMHT